jgi:heme/copper-type cytochrome/quinol oxidase subunit 2
LLFKCRFSTSNTAVHRGVTYNPFLVIKQKRYTIKKRILEKNFKTHVLSNNIPVKSSFFLENGVSEDTKLDLSKVYKFFKKNKSRTELFNVATSRRLLRTRHILLLPAHVNITAITNSYDVVHSWFIPGLGLKMDCIPGRATHHTFYADSVGFYYGQCAEICGRYHHHMPIRVCVLPYEQFLI